MSSADPYSRVEYRRLIAWPRRIRREWPLLDRALSSGPSRRVLDLGCGTGEHARFLAAQEFEVVAVDASPSMLEKAREEALPSHLRFVEGDLSALGDLVEGTFGGSWWMVRGSMIQVRILAGVLQGTYDGFYGPR